MSQSPSPLPPGSRRSPAARWAADTFSRESIFSGIKTLLWLVPLTLLIWIYAERSQVVTSPPPGETIPIDVRSSDPSRFYVKLMMPENDRSVIAQLEGPQARIEQVSKDIAPDNNNPSVILTIPVSQTGTVELDAAKELSLNPIFAHAGVSAVNCKPSTLKILVDDIVEYEADVQVRPEQLTQIASPVFTPAKVKIRGPKTELDAAKSQGPLVVYADFDKSVLQQPGSHPDLTVPLESDQFAGKQGISFIPSTIKATIDVSQSKFHDDVKAIPVNLLIPPDLNEKYVVQIISGANGNVLSSVPVIGPRDNVETLVHANPLKAIAILPIKLGTGDQSAIPEIRLPDAAVTVDPAYTPKEIHYTVTKRDQP